MTEQEANTLSLIQVVSVLGDTQSPIQYKTESQITPATSGQTSEKDSKTELTEVLSSPLDSFPINKDSSPQWLALIEQAKAGNKRISDFSARNFIISDDLNFRSLHIELPFTTFTLKPKADGSLPMITIGGDSNQYANPPQIFGKVLRDTFKMRDLATTQAVPTIRIMGAKGQSITLAQVDYLQLFMSSDPVTYPHDASIGYCNFDFKFVQKLEITTDPRYTDPAVKEGTGGTTAQWCNENKFHLNRCCQLEMTGSYRHNCNLFIGGAFENQYSYINLDSGAKNRFIHTRMEQIGYVRFGTNTEGNTIERSFYGSGQTMGIIPVREDLGMFNRISTDTLNQSFTQRVFEMTGSPTLRAEKTWAKIYESPMFEFRGREDFLVLDWDKEDSSYLISLEVYNEQQEKISSDLVDKNAGWLTPELKSDGTNRLKGVLAGGLLYGQRNFSINTAGVYFIKASIWSTRELTKQTSTYFTGDIYAKSPRRILPNNL